MSADYKNRKKFIKALQKEHGKYGWREAYPFKNKKERNKNNERVQS